LGAITIYAKQPDAFSEDEVNLLMELAGDLAYGITFLRMRAAHVQAERALRNYAEQYSAVLATTPDGFWLVDDQGRLIDVNEVYCRMSGYSREELLELSVPDLEEAENADEAQQHMNKIIESGSDRFETRHRTKDGNILDIEVSTTYLAAKGWFIVFLRDISERKQAEKALRESEQLYRAIGESIDYGVWVCDPDGRNIYASGSFLKLVGLTQEQCSNFGWGDVLHPDDAERTIAAWKECARTGGIWDIEHRFRGVDGQWHSVLARGVPVRNEQGKIIYWAGINLDISNLKEAEIALKEQTRQLEDANKELESFSYSVSHDLRAPLRAIDGYIRMILRKQGDKLDEETLSKFNVIRSSAQTMDKLIDDLLAFSRLSRKEMNMSKIGMNDLISDVWKELQIIYPDRNMMLTFHNIPQGYGDRALIKQVYFNLLSNAVKFTNVRDAAYIEAGSYVDDNEEVYYVRDNGVGFNMEYHDKLFGVFQRLHSSEEYEGTGVGLAIVQRIVHRHGGRIWAEGKENGGATFYFTLQGKEE